VTVPAAYRVAVVLAGYSVGSVDQDQAWHQNEEGKGEQKDKEWW
jgi:hypothetical protein